MNQTKSKGKNRKNNKKMTLSKIRRNNAKLYPIYKMFSWDLLCFYSVEFLFYTITKKITASQILIIDAFYILFKILMQIPSVTIADILGRKRSIVIGNLLVSSYLIVFMMAHGMIGMIFASFICAFGYDIKSIAETNLLYDSVSTKGGEGLYTKLDAKGGSWYYWLDAITCLSAGYLFIINNYLPFFICLSFTIISTILSFGFQDVYKVQNVEKKKITEVLSEYAKDLKTSIKFILKSNRMKSYILFGAVFYGIITIMDTYKSELLIDLGIQEEQFSLIFALLSLLAAISVTLSKKVHKKFRNRTLTFLSLSYIGACLVTAITSNVLINRLAIPIVLTMYAILRICTSIWYITEYKYLKNFTTEDMRNRIMFTYELIGGIVASSFSIIGSMILDGFGIYHAFLLVSLVGIIGIVLTLDYMRTRFGLKPNEYKKEDLEFKI